MQEIRRRRRKGVHDWHKRRMRRIYLSTSMILLAILSVGIALTALSQVQADEQVEKLVP